MANINKNIIMQAGAAVANAANKAAGLPASTPEPGSIISVIQLVNGGRTVGPDALAHFTESVRNKLLSLLVSMEPIQDFNGYGHPWPAGGGKNKFLTTMTTETKNAVTATVNADGTISFTGTANATTTLVVGQFTFPVGTYFVSICPPGGSASTYRVYASWGANDTGDGLTKTFSQETTITFTLNIDSGVNVSGLVCKPLICLDSESHTWEPYENISPISGRTGLHVYAGPTSAIGDAATYSMNWTSPAGTVYAGSADIVSGDIKAAPYYASYNGETLVGPWVSSIDVYDPDGTPTTGAQVVDLGGTMTEYHITGQDIITLVGDNYIWSDSGDVTIKE